MEPTPRETGDHADDRRTADVTTDPERRHVEARDHVRDQASGRPPRTEVPRSRVAGWPWAAALVLALALAGWLVFAVWFS